VVKDKRWKIGEYSMVLKQIFILNSDLKMGKGKLVGQAAHAIVYYMDEILLYVEGKAPGNKELFERFVTWRKEDNGLMKKIVFKASEEEMNRVLCELAVRGIEKFAVHDRGLTQIPEGSFTCIVVEPLEEGKCDELFRHLKLL
jgi:peptidyl-tRNA hydrolase, PTH2 family